MKKTSTPGAITKNVAHARHCFRPWDTALNKTSDLIQQNLNGVGRGQTTNNYENTGYC